MLRKTDVKSKIIIKNLNKTSNKTKAVSVYDAGKDERPGENPKRRRDAMRLP